MNYFWAFCVGGGICVVGQLLIDLTGLTPARILTGYVVAGASSLAGSLPLRPALPPALCAAWCAPGWARATTRTEKTA